METPHSLLSEERFLCSVCLDVFTKPVTTPCGHNFCSACIQKYWEGSNIYQCPLCKRKFPQRPELQVNTVVSELAAELKKLVQVKASTPDPQLPGTADVLCDICSKTKGYAVKSCLICLVSFCEEHLEPHQRVAALKGHTLLDPVKNLEDRMCKTHNKLAELYCRTEQACVCVLCFKTDHKSHSVVPLEEEYEAMMARKDDTMAYIQKMIQTRSEKMADMEISVNVSQREAEKEIKASVQVFADLIRSVLKSQAELVDAIEERCRAAKQKAEGFLADLRTEVAELQRRSSQLEQLSQSEDHHGFLQSFPALCSPLNKDWTNVSIHSNLCFEAVRSAVTVLKQRVCEIMEELPEIKMKRMREHAVDLTFDPDTAYSSLVISQDGKQVVDTAIKQNLPKNPKRFDMCTDVLAKEGFTTGRFYYEVQVKGKTEWIVGVVRESVNRKENIALSVKNGAWNMAFDGSVYRVHTCPSVKITLKEELQMVGIFVDYNEGVVSFYDVNSKSHIYSFTGYVFTEKLFPYFGLQGNVNGANSVPLIITPVPHTH